MRQPARFPLVLLALAICAGNADPAGAKTSLFVSNYVNSNEIQGITLWTGRLTMATLGGVVTFDPALGEFEKILRTPTGLPSNRILCLEVSPSGALWAGTAESGIARIRPDGTFRRTLSTFDGLPGDRVQAIYVRSDTVWVGTNAGVAILTESPATGQIGFTRSYTSASTLGALVGDDVRAFLQVGDTLWCATASGLSSFASGAWQNRTAALPQAATSLVFYADTLWAATASGPYQYVNGTFQAQNTGHAFSSQVLYAGSSGLYSGASLLGVYQYSGGSWIARNTGLPSLRVTAFRETPGGDFWVGTQNAIARFLPAGPSWEPHRSPGPIVNGTQRAVVDTRGVWIGTGNAFPPVGGRGVVLHFDGSQWSAITSSSTAGSFQQTDDFGVLSDRSGKLWFGHCCAPGATRPRVDRWDPATDTWDLPPGHNIWALDQAPDGTVYGASTELENGVYIFDGQTGALVDSLTPANSGLTSSNLRAIRFDSAGKGWIGTAFNGLDVWDGRGTMDHADDVWVHHSTTASDQISSIAVLDPQTAWIGTTAGASRLENGTPTRVLTTTGNPGLPSALVNDLALDTRGSLWIATSGGLARADVGGSGSIEVFTSKDGLVDDDVRTLAWDAAHGALWVGTARGISRVVPTTGGEPSFTDQTYLYPNPSSVSGGRLKLGGIQNALEGEIRDLVGNVVHRFRCDPASNEIWDFRDRDGAPIASGVYLVVLRDKGKSRTLRAAVVR